MTKRYLVTLFFAFCSLFVGCTETVHVSIWIRGQPTPMNNDLLKESLNSLGWSEDKNSASPYDDITYSNPSMRSCYLRQTIDGDSQIEIVFVKLAANRFEHAEVTAYHLILTTLVTTFGKDSVKAENINDKV